MKFILDENDNEYIERLNKDLQEGNNPPICIYQIGGRYYIEFECLDIAKANNFALNLLMYGRDINVQKEIEEKLGVSIKCIAYSNPDRKIDSLKEILKQALYDLDNL